MRTVNRYRNYALALALALSGCSAGGKAGHATSSASGGGGNVGGGGAGGAPSSVGGASTGGMPPVLDLPDGSAGTNAGGAGTDGVCKKLRIATIGRLGPWGASTLFTDWLQKEGTQPAVDLGDTVLTTEVLSDFDVIVALNVSEFPIVFNNQTMDANVSHTYSAEEAAALEGWVRAGGGLMTTTGYTPSDPQELTNVNALLAFSNTSYSATQMDLDGDVARFDPHEITTNVLKLSIDVGVRPTGTGGTVIGWDAQDREALMVATADDGRIVVWGDEWITYDEYWGNRPDLDIELFWVNVMNWLAPPVACKLPILLK